MDINTNYPLLINRVLSLSNDNELFGINNSVASHKWEAILNKNSGELWVAIKYTE